MTINGITTSTLSDTSISRTSTSSTTGSEKHKKPSVNDMLSGLTSKLGLNDNQQIEIKKLLQNAFTDDPMASLQPGTDASTIKSQADSKMEQLDSSIRNLLTDDQKATFDKMVEERKSNAPKGGSNAGGPPQGEKPDASKITSMLTSKLGLNDNQQIDVKSAVTKSLKKLESATSDDEKKSILDSMNDSISSLLSDDQKSVFSDFLSEMKGNN